jgi:Raf kinase inhibitor-like YbhB/YbcL family protein
MMEDPDAPQPEPWVHWIAHGIPGTVRSLSEGGAEAGTEATNSLGNKRYDGPMPPLGHGVHHYRFVIYALDEDVHLDRTITRKDVMDALGEHILGTAEMTATYERPL